MQPYRNRIYQLLRNAEKYLKTDLVYLAKGGFWLSLGHGTALLFSFALSIVFANFLPKETYGIYKYILSAVGILGVFTLTGLPGALVQAVSRGMEGTMRRAFWINMRWSILLIAGSTVGAAYYFFKGNDTLATAILIAGSFSPFMNSGALYGAYLQGKKNFRKSSFFSTIRNLFPTLVLAAGAVLTDSPIVLVLLYFASNTIVLLFLYWATFRHTTLNAAEDPGTLSFAKHSSLINILAGIADRIDSVLLFQHIGAAQLAIYTFANAIPENINGALKNLATLAMPKFAQRETRDIRNDMTRKVMLLTLALIPIALLYALFAPSLFAWIFPQYIDAVFYSQILAITIMINGTLPVAFLDAKMAIRQKYILSFSSNIFKIIALIIGIIWYGIMGAVIARILSKLFGWILALSLTRTVR